MSTNAAAPHPSRTRTTAGRRRHRVVVDTSALARRIGGRLKAARLRAGLTQQQLAEGRYTKAYVSALENGLVKPSMAALDFLAERLGVPASSLISDEAPAWTRLEADLRLAAGRWLEAADGYRTLLAASPEPAVRADVLVGLAEALIRLDQPSEAVGAASEAADLFTRLGRQADAARATYWLAGAQYELENSAEARNLLTSILAAVRAGLAIEPRFHLRVLMALATVEARDGNHAAALGYLEEVRALESTLDDRRRATFLYDLALSYRETGDLEAAIRTGHQSLALFRGLEAEAETAVLENDLALSFLVLPNLERAAEHAASARRRFERLGDERMLAHVTDTEARIALAGGDQARALDLAERALALAKRTSNEKATVDALATRARALVALGRPQEANEAFERAADLARAGARPGRLREVLGEWADLLAQIGDHRRAYEISREALQAG